jgi:hypothetical protein
MSQWAMGQMGRQKLMGHMGHGLTDSALGPNDSILCYLFVAVRFTCAFSRHTSDVNINRKTLISVQSISLIEHVSL